jgi:hypothetical protein
MKQTAWIKLALSFALVAMLAACGGGTGSTSGGGGGGGTSDNPVPVPAPNNAAFASAAMYVPVGQPSATMPLSECIQRTNANTVDEVRTTVADAQVMADSAGNLVFSGSVGTATRAELVQIKFSDTEELQGAGRVVGANYINYYLSEGASSIELEPERFFAYPTTDTRYECTVTWGQTPFALQVPPSASRVVSTLLSNASGTVTISGIGNTAEAFSNNIASWNPGLPRTNALSPYLSFNVLTAEFGSGPSLDATTHTPASYQSLMGTDATATEFREVARGKEYKYFQALLGHLSFRVFRLLESNTVEFIMYGQDGGT